MTLPALLIAQWTWLQHRAAWLTAPPRVYYKCSVQLIASFVPHHPPHGLSTCTERQAGHDETSPVTSSSFCSPSPQSPPSFPLPAPLHQCDWWMEIAFFFYKKGIKSSFCRQTPKSAQFKVYILYQRQRNRHSRKECNLIFKDSFWSKCFCKI